MTKEESRVPEICLGSAQFGMIYGITNTIGRIDISSIKTILKIAYENDIRTIDTAQQYGDAEEILGVCIEKEKKMKIINKLKPSEETKITKKGIKQWKQSLEKSFNDLRVDSIDTLLLHSVNDLKKEGSEMVYEFLQAQKNENKVNRIGISIYEKKDLDNIDLGNIDVVQLPLSILDQRLVNDGTIKELSKQGIKIHARSIFLQGLLLKDESEWPNWVKSSSKNHHRKLKELAKTKKCEMIDLALGYAKAQNEIENIIVGLCSEKEIRELIRIWESSNPWNNNEWERWGINDIDLLDPRRWKGKEIK